MDERKTCRFCGRSDGALRRVSIDGDATRTMTRSRRATISRLDRIHPVFEHAACLIETDRAAKQANADRHAAAKSLIEQARALRAAGDEAGAIALLDEAADL
jgi:hypothetical protein